MDKFRRSDSHVITVLQFFSSRIGTGNALTVEEIWEALRVHYESLPRPRPRPTRQRLTVILQHLAELGLVALANRPEESSGFPRWCLGQSWRPTEPPFGGGDGGGGRTGPVADDGDGDEGGGGLREALGHPVLFALPEEDFDELVDGLFEGVLP